MKKKFKKIVKLVIVYVLSIVFVITVYAENGGGDGRAFVTKNEFDKALADFNKRLTTFETGINSKIDVQVSSYLDRNGIWSKRPVLFNVDGNKSDTYNFESGFDNDVQLQKLSVRGNYEIKDTGYDWVVF